MRFSTARVEKMPLNIRIQWNAGTVRVSECVLKTLTCRGLRVGPSKDPTKREIDCDKRNLRCTSLQFALQRCGHGAPVIALVCIFFKDFCGLLNLRREKECASAQDST